MRLLPRFAALVLATSLAACGGGSSSSSTPPPAAPFPAPWQRTEERAPCDDFDPLRQPLFGDLHVHTRFSADATIYGTKTTPRDAYDFAQGAEIAVADADEAPTRRARLARPIDFAAVTDHAEFYGEVDVCTLPDSPAFDLPMCRILRQAEDPAERFRAIVPWLFPAGIADPDPFHRFCNTPGVDCATAKISVWQEIQAAAEEAYDRSAACRFTSFIGYEHTASPGGRHLHRNVIFRNQHVPPYAASQVDTFAGGIPHGLWSFIEEACLDAGTGCDAVIIPHNPNQSGGGQFFDPADRADAQRRQDLEPLVELHQQKGNSECRYDRLAGRGVGTEDELCAYEQLLYADEVPPSQPPPTVDEYPARNLIRNAIKDGLGFEETLGANPFKFGFIGSTDTHNSTAGNTDDAGWSGGGGSSDATAERQIDLNLDSNPGGLAVVWAEENSRDAVFAALQRRETYATSGTRPLVRFFGGELRGVSCDGARFVENGYRSGVPMGGELGPPANGAPRFAVLAMRDPGTETRPGNRLQRVQIIKGWLDADGQPREAVFDVAGDPDNGADVDPSTCAPRGPGAHELCAVWEDPGFDPSQRAVYYARVLENPTCRWSTLVCKANGVDPFSPDCAAQVDAAGAGFADCCLTQADDPFLSPLTQERAWTSPIWYRPEAIAAVAGGVRFGPQTGTDRLDLDVVIGRLPAEVDPDRDEIVVRVADDDEIHRFVVPAGSLAAESAARFALPDGALAGLDAASLERMPDGSARLSLRSAALDLAAADRVDHFVEVAVAIGSYRAAHTRWWRGSTQSLEPPD